MIDEMYISLCTKDVVSATLRESPLAGLWHNPRENSLLYLAFLPVDQTPMLSLFHVRHPLSVSIFGGASDTVADDLYIFNDIFSSAHLLLKSHFGWLSNEERFPMCMYRTRVCCAELIVRRLGFLAAPNNEWRKMAPIWVCVSLIPQPPKKSWWGIDGTFFPLFSHPSI